MAVFNLPYDIFPNKAISKEDIIIHDYSPPMGSFKGQSVLHKNAISLVISGEKTMHFAEKTVKVTDGEIHFLSSGNFLASIDVSREKKFRSILIFFDDKVLSDFYLKNKELVTQLKENVKTDNEPYISLSKDEFISNYISSLLLILKSGQPFSRQMRQLKFEELMLYLLEKYPLTILPFHMRKKNNFDDLQIRKTIESNVISNLTLRELAFLCNLSLSTFKRRFEKIYNSSPNKWLLHRRMSMAGHMLHSGKEKPSSIYHKLGYENHSSFSKSFKQVHGMTPKEYQSKLDV